MAIPAPRSLRGIAQDIITQKNGGRPPSDDEPLREVQVIEWLIDAAATQLQTAIVQAIQYDDPLPDRWYLPTVVTLEPYITGGSTRSFSAILPVLPATMMGEPLVKDIQIGGYGIGVELVKNFDSLNRTARGWGRLPKPKPAAFLRGTHLMMVLPEYLWDTRDVHLGVVNPNPLAGANVDDELAVPRDWISPMMAQVIKERLALTMGGIPDVLNDDTGRSLSPGPNQ